MTVLTAEQVNDIAAQLDDDGATVELPSGESLRLHIGYDDVNPFDDVDCYGRIANVARFGGYGTNERGYALRPQGFDGNAEKLDYDRGESVWWQPPTDVPRSSEHFAALRRHVLELLERGYYVVRVELRRNVDAYRRPIVVDVASLFGVDSIDDGYLTEIVAELLSEIGFGQ